MKFINIKSIKTALLLVLTTFVISSCEDTDKAPIVTFDTAGHGAYPRLISEGSKLVNILSAADFSASSYTYTIEFVDENDGKNVAEYILELEYDDNDASNGDNSVSGVEIMRVAASSFVENAIGLLELANVTITANDLATAVGVSFADITAGDNFNISGKVIMNDGSVFAGSNSSASVVGAAFRGHFDFTMPAACPSSLEQTVNFSTVVGAGHPGCSGGETVTGTVDIVALGAGVYQFSDWAFGAYGPCYGGGTAGGDLTFTETCTVVAFTGFTDSFGDTWTFVSSISGNDWTIDWVNTYAEEAVSVITFPGPVPFTLAP